MNCTCFHAKQQMQIQQITKHIKISSLSDNESGICAESLLFVFVCENVNVINTIKLLLSNIIDNVC